MNDNKMKLRYYKMLLNHWKVAADKKTIDEMEKFCKINQWAYERTENLILLLETIEE